MWNFNFVLPTLLILAIILVNYFSLPRLNVKRNRVFVSLMALETLTIVADILSSIADNAYQTLPIALVHLLNIAFFVCFYIRSWGMFIFTVSSLHLMSKRSAFLLRLAVIPLMICLAVAVSSPFTGLIYSIREDGYHSGPFYPVLYLLSLLYIFLSFAALFLKDRRLVTPKEFHGLTWFNIVLLLGISLRYLLPHYLLMDTFCLMAILIVYLHIENPEFCLDQRTGTFNFAALGEYTDEHLRDPDLSFFGLIIHKYREMRNLYGANQMNEGLRMIGTFLKELEPGCNVFYLSRGRFVMTINPDQDISALCEKVSERCKKPWKSEVHELYLEMDYAALYLAGEKLAANVLLSSLAAALDQSDDADDHVPVVINQEDFAEAGNRIRVRKCFEDALEHNHVEVFLQPLINVEKERITGAEALSRIRDNEGKIIPPSQFIPIAGASGTINLLGEQVFEKTCAFIRDHREELRDLEWINVNLSPIQFLRADLADRYAEIAASYQVDPGMLHLEITEESMIDDRFFLSQIEALTRKGFKFVLDDYGTGYSNLTRLKKCPFISIKLDMEVVWDYCTNPDEVLPMMIHAFKHMGFSITAEGIENKHMADAMKAIGCDYFQGFYFAKPLSMEEFTRKLRLSA